MNEFNGTKAILKKNGLDIVGQMEMTMTSNGTLIDISNKSFDDFVTLLNGELVGKQKTNRFRRYDCSQYRRNV